MIPSPTTDMTEMIPSPATDTTEMIPSPASRFRVVPSSGNRNFRPGPRPTPSPADENSKKDEIARLCAQAERFAPLTAFVTTPPIRSCQQQVAVAGELVGTFTIVGGVEPYEIDMTSEDGSVLIDRPTGMLLLLKNLPNFSVEDTSLLVGDICGTETAVVFTVQVFCETEDELQGVDNGGSRLPARNATLALHKRRRKFILSSMGNPQNK